jgi:tRNA(Ile)-lysidine synthase
MPRSSPFSAALVASIQRVWPVERWCDQRVVVAVSGGPDSVALLDALHRMAPDPSRLLVAHFNHGLRGEQSDGDAAFVQSMAEHLRIECVVGSMAMPVSEEAHATEALQSTPGPRSESWLRTARHRFLKEVAMGFDAAWIATGHTADDVVETMLHHLMRGSGPAGLASIPPMRRLRSNLHLVHPLIFAFKADVLAYLEEREQSYRRDASNDSMQYTRNRIRHQLLPWLREFTGDPRVADRLRTAAEWIREEHAVIEECGMRWLASECVMPFDDGLQMPLAHALSQPWAVVREGLVAAWHDRYWPLREMSAKHWERLRRFLDKAAETTHPQRMQLPGPIGVSVRRKQLRFMGPDAIASQRPSDGESSER